MEDTLDPSCSLKSGLRHHRAFSLLCPWQHQELSAHQPASPRPVILAYCLHRRSLQHKMEVLRLIKLMDWL